MLKQFEGLPDWQFEIEEVSANIFKVIGRDATGHLVERVGTDPDLILRQCKVDAKKTMHDSNNSK